MELGDFFKTHMRQRGPSVNRGALWRTWGISSCFLCWREMHTLLIVGQTTDSSTVKCSWNSMNALQWSLRQLCMPWWPQAWLTAACSAWDESWHFVLYHEQGTMVWLGDICVLCPVVAHVTSQDTWHSCRVCEGWGAGLPCKIDWDWNDFGFFLISPWLKRFIWQDGDVKWGGIFPSLN